MIHAGLRRLYCLSSLLFIVLLAFQPTNANNWLTISNPQAWWYRSEGIINEAQLVITPVGAYLNYDMYLTISAIPGNFSDEEILEIVLDFELPERAIVHDSWLWFKDTILIAEILDRWTANAIYESIVQRNQDPSILFKQSGTQYQIRVFPMAATESRRFRISWMQPATWTRSNVIADLPIHILQTTSGTPPALSIYVNPNGWGVPFFNTLPTKQFLPSSSSEFRGLLHAKLAQKDFSTTSTIAFQSPAQDGVFISTYSKPDESFYQLVFFPSQVISESKGSKVVVVVDYDQSKTLFSKQYILSEVKQILKESLAEKDSFNLILSGLNVYKASESWIPATSEAIDGVFADITASTLSNNSYLSQALSTGINFVRSIGKGGSIILLAASDAYLHSQAANSFMADIKSTYPELPVIHTIDFNNTNTISVWQGGRYYYGNEYFYNLLTRQTGGNLFLLTGGVSIYSALSSAMQSSGDRISIFDMQLSLSDGFCYGRVNPTPIAQPAYFNRPLVQFGKFLGTPPFNLQLTGVHADAPFSGSVELNASAPNPADSLLKTIWTGNFIQELERSGTSNDIISEIISYSISNRVLSLYTAFLALEPGMSTELPPDTELWDERNDWWWEDGTPIGIDEQLIEKPTAALAVKAYPTPFTDNLSINVSIPEGYSAGKYSIRIFNMSGAAVKTFDNLTAVGNEIKVVWDGRDAKGSNLPSGSYFVVARIGTEIKTLVVIKH